MPTFSIVDFVLAARLASHPLHNYRVFLVLFAQLTHDKTAVVDEAVLQLARFLDEPASATALAIPPNGLDGSQVHPCRWAYQHHELLPAK